VVEYLMVTAVLVAGAWVGVAGLPRLQQPLLVAPRQELVLQDRLQDAAEKRGIFKGRVR